MVVLPVDERQTVGQVAMRLRQLDAFVDFKPVVLIPEDETQIEQVSSHPVLLYHWPKQTYCDIIDQSNVISQSNRIAILLAKAILLV